MAQTTTGFLPPEYQADLDQAARRAKLAELMLGRAQQRPGGKMVGRFYVPSNPLEHLGALGEQYFGQKAFLGADQARTDVLRRYAGDEQKALADLLAKAQGTPSYGAGEEGPTMEVPDAMSALQSGAGSQFPRVQNLAKILTDQRLKAFEAGAKNADPKSIQGAVESGMDPTKLTPKAEDYWEDITIDSPFPNRDGTVRRISAQRNRRTQEIRVVDRPPTPQVEISNSGERDLLKQDRESLIKQMDDLRAEGLKSGLAGIPQRTAMAMKALEILNDGNLNTGTGAGILTALQKAGGLAGFQVDPKAPETEIYNAFVKTFLPQLLQGFAPISEGEVKMAMEQLPTGQMSPVAMKAVLAQIIENSIRSMGTYNQRVEATVRSMAGAGMPSAEAGLANIFPFPGHQRPGGGEPELMIDALQRLRQTPQNLPAPYRPAAPQAPKERSPKQWTPSKR